MKHAAKGKQLPQQVLTSLDPEKGTIENLDKEDRIELVNQLLRMIQPYLSANNLTVAPPLELKSTARGGKPGDSVNLGMDNSYRPKKNGHTRLIFMTNWKPFPVKSAACT